MDFDFYLKKNLNIDKIDNMGDVRIMGTDISGNTFTIRCHLKAIHQLLQKIPIVFSNNPEIINLLNTKTNEKLKEGK